MDPDDQLASNDTAGPVADLPNTFNTPTNFPSLWSPIHETTGPYQKCLICSRIVTFMGIMPVPSCGLPGTPPAYIQVHAPFQIRLVAWEVEKWGDAPQIPSPDTGNTNEVLVHTDINTSGPIVSNMANAWQRITGFYVYSIATPSDITKDGAPGVQNLASVIPAFVANVAQSQFTPGAIAPLTSNPTSPVPTVPYSAIQRVAQAKNPGTPQ